MDRRFLKTSLAILSLFIVEIFISGFSITLIESKSLDLLVEHFKFSFEHYVEIAFFHLFSMSTILFILLHLQSVLHIRNRISLETLLAYALLCGSHIFWYLLGSFLLKIFTTISLFLLVLHLLYTTLKKAYFQI